MLYLGKTKTNHNCIHDYIKKKNKSGKFLAFSSESSVFSSPILYCKQVEGIFFSLAQRPNSSLGRIVVVVHRSHAITHTHTHNIPPNEWSAPRRDLYLCNTQKTTPKTNIHALSEIRTRNLSKQEAADLRLTPRGHWDRWWNTSSLASHLGKKCNSFTTN